MVFSSLVFLFTFLPLSLLLYYITPKKGRNAVLLLVSLIFYAWGEPIYVFLMLFSIVIDYIHGLIITKYRQRPMVAKLAVASSITINLGLLFFFKYTDFFISNLNHIFNLQLPLLGLDLPIGISFYTFQTMSYAIDIYRQEADYQKKMLNFGAYVSMFPQLIAGPIVRYQTVAQQLRHRRETWADFSKGALRFIIGLGKKVLLANNIAILWSRTLETPLSQLSILSAWLGLLAFALQIYFDFSAYSDMAIGLAKMFGFDFLENFNYPYVSKSITEFWRRWHISLGTWFRDYVYIPLGGNRKGRFRTYVNIFIVWFLTGFWHGASWNFILWGLYFGILLMLEKRFLLAWLKKMPAWLCHGYTLVLVLIGWGLFVFEDFTYLTHYFRLMFGLAQAPIYRTTDLYHLISFGILFVAMFIGATPLPVNAFKRNWRQKDLLTFAFCVAILILSTAYLVDSSYNPFLYFRF